MKPYEGNEPKREQIRKMFDTIAPKYDTLNHLLSFGIDRRWRNRVVREVIMSNPSAILDVATGTGDMAIALACKIAKSRVDGIDISEGMIEIGRRKVAQDGLTDRVTFRNGAAESLPFTDGVYDAVTVAFGVRNFHDIPQGLSEMFRVTRSGGKVCVLEFSTPDNKIFGALYRFYFHRVLPWIGGVMSKDRKAYKYLPESVDEFPDADRFAAMMLAAGASQCRVVTLMTGVARIYIGEK